MTLPRETNETDYYGDYICLFEEDMTIVTDVCQTYIITSHTYGEVITSVNAKETRTDAIDEEMQSLRDVYLHQFT